MKKYFKPLILIYIALALLVSGYLFINPPLTTREFLNLSRAQEAAQRLPKGHRFVEISHWTRENGQQFVKLITYNDNYAKYSLLFFSVGGLVLYAIFLLKKAEE